MEIMFPVGRMVGGGSLYKLFPVTDNKGLPKMDRSGQPMTKCNFGVAIPKDPATTHWSQTAWGQKIVSVAQAAFPNGEFNSPLFAWKILDGDSTVPNKKGNVPCKNVAYPGNWVIWFSQSWLPKLCNADGSQALTEPDSIVPGYFVQVLGDVIDNKPSESPGVFMNPRAVALAGYGEKILGTSEVNTVTAGFGGALPPGASAAPVGVMQAPVPVGLVVPPPVAAAVMPPIVVPPNTAYMSAPPPPAPRWVTNAAGQSAPYDQMIDNGWTDTTLHQHGWN